MIKPKIRHGKQCLEKRFSDLEEGEFFLHPATGNLCSVMNKQYSYNMLKAIKFYDYKSCAPLVRYDTDDDLEEFVQLVKVEIVYWLAEEKDLFQEKG